VPIDILGELVSIGTLFAFILVCASVLILRRTEPDLARPFRVPGGATVPVLGILACLALMASLPGDTWLRLLAWLGLGLAIWFGYGRRRVEADPGFERTRPSAGPGQSPG
jgi:APA family basic amino acid/polyamine antiporter